ncbi:thioredoxin-like 3-3 [Vigna unguiculata]|uniref:Thioredoxin 1 n=1 Tax=Vigna unguiculata TaxID=3917 RepID=A0A4D6MC05_VIGUN|nr:thioredoxin-like 3-3 [Vigna unguiculata]QCD97941.1 thioredoxin 1 [Vigna unguiculata]
MEGSSSMVSNQHDKAKKGLEGTALDIPINRYANLKSATSDDDFTNVLAHIKSSKTPAVINYGASWCRVCSQILPAFCRLSNNFPKLTFVYADIDECPETTQHIRYTPTFQFYRNGEKVDEMYGTGEERLHDRLWLHS